MDRGRDRNILGADILHGTAAVRFREDRKRPPLESACQSQIFDPRQKKHRNGRLKFKTLVKAFFPCIRKETDSYSPREGPAADADTGKQITIAHTCTQDHDKDAYFRHLIASTGRPCCLPALVSAKDINVSVRNGATEEKELHVMVSQHEMLPKTGGDASTSPASRQMETGGLTASGCSRDQSDNLASRGNLAKNLEQALSRETDMVSGKQEVRNYVRNEDGALMTRVKSVGTYVQNTTDTLADDLKRAVTAATVGFNQLDDPLNHLTQRSSVRERSLYTRMPKFRRFQPKDFLALRSATYRQKPHVRMMTSSNEWCYPSHSDTEARRRTLRNCTDHQLRNFGREELANAGWFFNRRILTTFCCGMEMHTFSNCHPLDVHLGLSPHCEFALGLQRSSLDAGGDDQAPSGEGGFHFCTPVQVTDDAPVQAGVAEWSLPSASEGFPALTFEETTTGDHWMTDGTSIAGGQTSHVSYPRSGSLVTNRTDLSSEQWQPYTPRPQQPAVQQRAEGSRQSTQPRVVQGQLSMRFNATDPFTPAGDPAVESLGHELPPTDYVADFDQLNLDGPRNHDHVPRYPHLGLPVIRMSTYEGWPSGHAQTAGSLVDAGFFYAGYDDSVVCYSCGIGARRWLPTDDPWIEHARLLPSCYFVKTLQGQHFIDVAREMTRNNQHPTYREVRLEGNRRRRAEETASGGDAASRDEDEEALELLCRMCYTRDRNTMLMPCRHLAVCETCGMRLQSCPVCRAVVESSFQASLHD